MTMAKRGPKPKPTALKKLLGNPGKRPLPEREPQPDPTMPHPPAHLDELACAEWARMAPELNRMRLLTQVDRAAFAGYCVAYSRWVQACRALGSAANYTHVTAKGNVIQHPLVGIANKAQELMLRFLTEFGLTPSSRSRVSVPNTGVDEFERDFGTGGREG